MKIPMIFAYYDYREIPEELLNYLLRIKDKIYRQGYAVMFEFKTEKDSKWRKLLDFVNTQLQVHYRYIVLESNLEDVGCLEAFNIKVVRRVEFNNNCDIDRNISYLKVELNIEHADFDIKVVHGI